MPAFIGGGFLPARARGRVLTGYIHAADWYDHAKSTFDSINTSERKSRPTDIDLHDCRYPTFCLLAGGVDCHESNNPAVSNGTVPGVDGSVLLFTVTHEAVHLLQMLLRSPGLLLRALHR